MISIIIPTLDEEKRLLFLLSSIKNQNFPDLEIILADAGSEDRTIEIAEKEGCRIIKGGSPSKGRNEGAKVARGDLLFFLDADTFLSADFLEKALKEFQERKLDVASFCLDSQAGRMGEKFLFNFFYNWPILFLEKILAHATQAILVKKEVFEKVKGFDEEVKFAEDHNFVRRVSKIGRFGIIRSVKIPASLRRFEKDGWVLTYFRYILAELHMIFLGDIKKEIFKYKFGHYKK
jgi:glycosyltransferase involved in cell wall biosynthesis